MKDFPRVDRYYLHIGMLNTGSTSIQQAFRHYDDSQLGKFHRSCFREADLLADFALRVSADINRLIGVVDESLADRTTSTSSRL